MNQSPKRIVFFGSASFACPALELLAKGPDKVVLAVCPLPAPAGRGRHLTSVPLAEAAVKLGVPVLETDAVKAPEVISRIAGENPDILVVAAFGGMLPSELLNLCSKPPLNIHPSLLPGHRGPAPVNWSLIQGDQAVGVSIIFLEKKMDAGPILRQKVLEVPSGISAGELEAQLAIIGAQELSRAIDDFKNGCLKPEVQDEALATTNRLLRKSDGLIDWSRPAGELVGLINGVDPWPGAQTANQGKKIKVFKAWLYRAGEDCTSNTADLKNAEPGQFMGLDNQGRLIVAAGEGTAIIIGQLQPEGKKRLKAQDFFQGYRFKFFDKQIASKVEQL